MKADLAIYAYPSTYLVFLDRHRCNLSTEKNEFQVSSMQMVGFVLYITSLLQNILIFLFTPCTECCGYANYSHTPIDREENNGRKDKGITTAQKENGLWNSSLSIAHVLRKF